MSAYIHLLDEDISAHERGRLGVNTLFTDALSITSRGSRWRFPVENENHGGNASLETAQAMGQPAPTMRPIRRPELSQSTQWTDTATGSSWSATEGTKPIYKLYIGPGSYRLRPDGTKRSHSVFAWPSEVKGPDVYLLQLPATELPLENVWLIPATEAHRPRVVLQPAFRRPLPPRGELRLDREDANTGETRSVNISVQRFSIDAGKTPSAGSVRVGLRHV